jgi:hypothetical protein
VRGMDTKKNGIYYKYAIDVPVETIFNETKLIKKILTTKFNK